MTNIATAYKHYCKMRFALPSEKQVANVEIALNLVFPPDYRSFLLEYNGGFFTEPQILTKSEGCPIDCLSMLKGIGAEIPVADLNSIESLFLFDDNDPPQVLPIGYTLMGNLIFLIIHHDESGIIGLKRAFSNESYFLSANIEDFFGMLTRN